ncbi:MAG TPA: circadian clock protein KaiC [Planctomycetota bacterium]|nr:circadian clock protein KaiC [Planctomycetota bacterium]
MPRASVIRKRPTHPKTLVKVPSGVRGLDEITFGGLPRGRPTLVCGDAGCGKTLFGMQFLVRGALDHGEPGVFVAFEENADELTANMASLGHDLAALTARKRVIIDHVNVERHDIEETGEYDLEGLFVRLGHAIDTIGAKRVVLDSLEALFGIFNNVAILRAELRRLFRWLKERGVTAIITGERGTGVLSKNNLEDYVADCVILLDHRVSDQISTRRLRIVKYRGSRHATNEFPFLIDKDGIAVLPITSVGLEHEASSERVPTGIARLDTMLGGKGYFRGSSVLLTGTAGTGKSSLAAHFAAASCQAGKRCIYFAFEESSSQILRNMRSIGIDLQQWIDAGLLQIHAARSTAHGLEMHLLGMHKAITDFKPAAVVVDPISNFIATGASTEVKAMLTRLIDLLKNTKITSLFTSLTFGGSDHEATETAISSLMDTWILLRTFEQDGERNRGLSILKSRGMPHSNQIREFAMSERGIELVDVHLGPDGVMMGSARLRRQADLDEREQAAALEHARRARLLERKRQASEAHIAALRASFEAEQDEVEAIQDAERARAHARQSIRGQLARSRYADRVNGDARRTTSGTRT